MEVAEAARLQMLRLVFQITPCLLSLVSISTSIVCSFDLLDVYDLDKGFEVLALGD